MRRTLGTIEYEGKEKWIESGDNERKERVRTQTARLFFQKGDVCVGLNTTLCRRNRILLQKREGERDADNLLGGLFLFHGIYRLAHRRETYMRLGITWEIRINWF